jgi:hypothetical protein
MKNAERRMKEKRECVVEITVTIEKLHPDDHLFVERELIRFAKRLGIEPLPKLQTLNTEN